MTPRSENTDWLSIAEQVGEEVDPAKLRTLVKQLCSASQENPFGLDRPDQPLKREAWQTLEC